MLGRGFTLTRVWPDDPETRDSLTACRDDILTETRPTDGVFEQVDGPFRHYERRVVADGDQLVETTTYDVRVPWFGWLFRPLVRHQLRRRDGRDRSPWWSPPDHLDERQVLILGLVAALSMSSAFINTLFTQTVNFAADEFGVGDFGIGVSGAVVRAGIILTLPAALLADRLGRKRVVTTVAWLAPVITALGALAPTFPLLVVTQTVGRPLGLALDFLIAVIAAEEMPRNSRAYAVSVMAMASGLGAGLAVMSLPLADIGETSWRLIYVVTAVWLLVALDSTRRLPETVRFTTPHTVAPRLDRRRFGVLAAVAFFSNVFVAPASFFQNQYLEDIRGFSGGLIATFTVLTATPAAIGLIIGGRIADIRGRRRLLAIALPTGTVLVALTFAVSGPPMWLAMFLGGFVSSIAYPAIAVYRSELFPTGNRGRAAGYLTAAALIGGIGGLLTAGALLDADWSHGTVMGSLALAQIAVVIVILAAYPETAHRTLEDLNPEDHSPATTTPSIR